MFHPLRQIDPLHLFRKTTSTAIFFTALLLFGYTNTNAQGPVDVIRNGGFEDRGVNPDDGIAADWQRYSNGFAEIGWYDERWPEAVRSGDHAQLMEIDYVTGGNFDRTIAIFQTVEVVPNSQYDLMLYAIMRSDAQQDDRNKGDYAMQWGVDPFGQGIIDNVEQWVDMPLTEQLRIGSNGQSPDNKPLVYEEVGGIILTGPENNRITLFIRGVKKFPTGTEINFDVDDVSLVGPIPPLVAAPATEVRPLPVTGSPYPGNSPVGTPGLAVWFSPLPW